MPLSVLAHADAGRPCGFLCHACRVPYESVRHLTAAYFHQDYREEAGDAFGVLDMFRTDNTAFNVARLVTDVDALLSSTLTEADVRSLWLDTWGASYDPADDGLTCREWLLLVKERMAPVWN